MLKLKYCYYQVIQFFVLCVAYARAAFYFIQDPFGPWREALYKSLNPAYKLFIEARKDSLAKLPYHDYVLALWKTRKRPAQFLLPSGTKINLHSIQITQSGVLINDQWRTSLQYLEGLFGVASPRHDDMKQTLDYFQSLKLKSLKKPLKVSTVVPFYDREACVLVNDEYIISYPELDKMIPGGTTENE